MAVRSAAPITTARIFRAMVPPATSKTALTGRIGCRVIDSSAPIVAINTTSGKPTTNRVTVSAKHQIKKLLAVAI